LSPFKVLGGGLTLMWRCWLCTLWHVALTWHFN